MPPLVSTLNLLVAAGAVVLQVGTLILLAILALEKSSSLAQRIARYVERWGVAVSFLLFSSATIMSVYYSAVLGFVPCSLCWWQRVFMFPQVVLLGIALVKKDRGVADTSIALSILGSAVALYQHYLQMGGSALAPCLSVGSECAQRIMFEFGYVTFPLVAFSTFAFALVVMLFVRRISR